MLHVGGQYRGSENLVVEAALGRLRGVVSVEANPAAQTASVTFDPGLISLEELRRCVQSCGFDCAGCNVPGCVCDPLQDPGVSMQAHTPAAVERAHDPAGHGTGGHGGHSMDHMARDLRNRFIVALLFTVPILLWSSIGKSLFGHYLATPLGSTATCGSCSSVFLFSPPARCSSPVRSRRCASGRLT